VETRLTERIQQVETKHQQLLRFRPRLAVSATYLPSPAPTVSSRNSRQPDLALRQPGLAKNRERLTDREKLSLRLLSCHLQLLSVGNPSCDPRHRMQPNRHGTVHLHCHPALLASTTGHVTPITVTYGCYWNQEPHRPRHHRPGLPAGQQTLTGPSCL